MAKRLGKHIKAERYTFLVDGKVKFVVASSRDKAMEVIKRNSPNAKNITDYELKPKEL